LLRVIIIAEKSQEEDILATVENLQWYGIDDFVVATNEEKNQKVCDENEIIWFSYKKLSEIYLDHLGKTADYVLYLHAGDELKLENREVLQRRLQNDNVIIGKIEEYSGNNVFYDEYAREILDEKVNIEENPEKIWVHLNSVFLSRELLEKAGKVEIGENKYYAEVELLTKLICLNGGFFFKEELTIKTNDKLETSKMARPCDYDEEWYFGLFESYARMKNFTNGNAQKVNRFTQKIYLKLLLTILADNTGARNKHIVVGKKLEKFESELKKILQDMDDDIIMSISGNKQLGYALVRLKYGLDKIEYRSGAQNLSVVNNGEYLFGIDDSILEIIEMECENGILHIVGKLNFPIDEKQVKILAKYDDLKEFVVKKSPLYSDHKIFGKTVFKKYAWTVDIPLEESKEKQFIQFFIQAKNGTVQLLPKFTRPLAKLTRRRFAYWNVEKWTINYRKKGLMLLPNRKLRHLKREFLNILSMLFRGGMATKCGIIRTWYWLTRPYYKNKRIWLFEDKIYKGGDNGEYLYTYACQQKNDGISKYYILDRKCLDAQRFRKEGKKFTQYCSIKHKMLYLNGEVIFNTHNGSTEHHGFSKRVEIYFRDLFKADNVCIQHGLSVQYIPNLVNQVNDNLKMFFLASEVEKKNLLNSEYAWEGKEDRLFVTGSPRYDGLKDKDQRQILITPTWRNYLAVPVSRIDATREKNDDFIKSDYFKIYNNLINDEKLIAAAKKYNYKIIYLLHPCTASQIDDFDRNNSVELVASTADLNYEKIMTESSLMVTDYSGVQFDFAYMYKPVVYYHPEKLPPSYDEGEYKYATMSLGEIIKTQDDLVESLCEYMKNDCKIKDEYRKRIDKFFSHHDFENCKRVYEVVKQKYQK